MAYGLIGLYALYFVFVGIRGNASSLVTQIESDTKGFIPWLVVIIVLRVLYSSETLRPMIKPFIGLAALTFVLKNYSMIATQLNALLPSNAQIPIK